MALERGIPDYWIWLLGDPVQWSLFDPTTWGFLQGSIAIILALLVIAPFFAFVVTSLQYGPSEAFYYVARNMFTAVTVDLPGFSSRRTLAVARLAIQEAIRNRVLVGFGVFIVLLLFAGLFMDVNNNNPSRVYLSFVLTSTNFLVLLMALFLAAFSIPNDIKNRTIYTVVTKPVRASEVVLGRTLGFAAVGTVMLLVMAGISYGFVTRGLAHGHAVVAEVAAEERRLPDDTYETWYEGETTLDRHHRHTFEIGPDGKGRTNVVQGHWHEVERLEDGTFRVGPPQGHLIARAPVYGKLIIYESDGRPGKGINVGNEWEYRGFIEGGTPGVQTRAHAVWTFTGVTPERYPDGLPLEMNLRVFRTHKGDIERGVMGEIVVRNPDPAAPIKRSGPILFESKEYVADLRMIPVKLQSELGGRTDDLDLFRDLVHDGKVEIEIRCIDPGQYFGVAEPDVYLRPGDASFEWNFVKAYVSIWLQMLLVTSFGVMFSTFLTGPVAMMATLSAIVTGFFGEKVRAIASGQEYGGGPIESFIRIVTQQNVMTELEMAHPIVVSVVQGADWIVMNLMRAGTYVLPDYTRFDTTQFVADGYNIFGALMGEQLTMAAVYFTAATVIGYFFLKTREIAA